MLFDPIALKYLAEILKLIFQLNMQKGSFGSRYEIAYGRMTHNLSKEK